MPRGINIYDQANIESRLLTPLLCAQRFAPRLGYWYSADYLIVSTSNAVVQATDLTGRFRHATQTTIANRLTYFPSDPQFQGRPSFGSVLATGTRFLNAPTVTVRTQIFSLYYRDGADNTWDSASVISQTSTGGASRITADAVGGSGLLTGGVFTSTLSLGGRAQQNTILPLPSTVCVATTGSAASLALRIGGSASGTTWQGAFRHFLTAPALLQSWEVSLIEGVIAWDDGTQNRLVPTHPFAYRPPLIGD